MVIMDDAEISFVRNRKQHGFVYLLSSAVCEWLLMLLLFVEAVFAYLLPKFAQYCELQAPCPLCSRLDNVFAKKKPGFCWTLICRNHKEEISTLVPCAIHGDLADIEGMCEECSMFTASQRSSNSEAYKLLVGKLWVDVERSALQNLLLNNHIRLGSSGLGTCSCCNKKWRAKSSSERLLELEQAGLRSSKASPKPPLPRIPGRSRFSRRDLRKLRDTFTGSMAQAAAGRYQLSHVGYTKIKFNSGSESEFLFSEDEDDNEDDDGTVSGGSNFSRSDYDVKIVKRSGIPRPPVKNVGSGKQVRQDSKHRLAKSALHKQKNVRSSSSDTERGNGLRGLKRGAYDQPSPSLATDLASSDDVSRTPDVSDVSTKFSAPRAAALSALSEIYSSSIAVTRTKSTHAEGTSEKVKTSVTVDVNVAAEFSSDVTPASEPNTRQADSGEHDVEKVNASDSSKIEEKFPSLDFVGEVGNSSKPHNKMSESRGEDDPISPAPVQAPPSIEGSISQKETCPKPHNEQTESIKGEDSISQARLQISTSKVDDESPKETDPVHDVDHHNSREIEDSCYPVPSQVSVSSEVGGTLPKDTDTGTSYDGQNESITDQEGGVFPNDIGPRPHDKRIGSIKDEKCSYLALPGSPSGKKTEPIFETVEEIEGESLLDRLKRQVEHDKTIIRSLYEELDEERNAAAVAANEAMVMITKLQEEKAALRTEALQYLRMMEEQAEYDMEALQRANDLLAEREKELQDMEDELELYRNNFYEQEANQQEISVSENHVAESSENRPDESDSRPAKISTVTRNSSSKFENEKFYIVEFLKNIEEELHQAYCIEKLDDMTKRSDSENIKNGAGNLNDSSPDEETSSHSQTEDSTSIVQTNNSTSNGNYAHGTINNDFHEQKSDRPLDVFQNENAELNYRSKALETDRDFLKHASDLVWSGKEGLQLIQEVAHQLKELRMLEFKKR